MVERVFRSIIYTVETATANNQTLNGTPNPDWLEALGGDNLIFTGAGNDVVLAGVGFVSTSDNYPPYAGAAIIYTPLPDAGNNTVFAGTGNDYVAVGRGNDLVFLGEGNDIFDGVGGGNDTVFGGAGNDIINGGDTVFAEIGDDTLYADSTGDYLDGGAGKDFLSLDLSDETAGIVFDGTAKTHLTLADGPTARNWEVFDVVGGKGNDTLIGGAGNDTLSGELGNDILRGGAGSDLLRGGTGDTLDGGAGKDFLILQLFDQTAGIVFNGTASTHLTLADGTTARNGEFFTVYGGSGNDTLIGGAGIDFLRGGDGNDSVRGGAGDDYLIGAAGNDTITGDTGDDRVVGGNGNDSLRGDAGDDIIFGAGGNLSGDGEVDTLTGGSGSDLFVLGDDFDGVFYDSDPVSPANTDYAQITDFNFIQDRIQLTGAAINYSLVEGIVPNTGLSGTSIYLAGQTNELIGLVTGVTGLDLNASYFSYVQVEL